ncbi:hypothetical protein [Sphingomonas montanisoli]|uniref:Periplasmic heavy metal sensor n=1 Tax=Sphingomonas montanisoli TaxID=2606412 RepID=A0A5D9CFC3_9SPHN|nr:hypothetical protein [Sphingomonas montanisoli]TZG28831.1 hypothetical protein FYJ91_01415 [Sphingomonas montanisoli]
MFVRFALFAALAVPAFAAAPRPVAPAPVVLTPGANWSGLSPEGRTIAAQVYAEPDPRAGQLKSEIDALRLERLQLIAAVPIDVDALEMLLKKDEALQAERRKRSNDKLIELLRALPEADRATLLKTLAAPARPAR